MSTEVLIEGTGKRPLYRKVVRDGVAGNTDVLFQMVRIIRNDTKYDIPVNRLAADLLKNNGLNSYSPATDQFNALFNFVKSNIVYIQDEAGRVESLKSARVTLSDGYGDCDDQAILNATLLGSIGFEDVRIAMARYSAEAESFQHVYAVCYVNGERFVFDTTLPDATLNKEVKTYETKEIPVYTDVKGLDGLSGVYNNLRYYGRKTARTAVKMVPFAGAVLPLGFVADQALTMGVQAIGGATGNNQTLSLPATASSINQQLDEIINDLLKSRIASDLAKVQALQISSQLMATEIKPEDHYSLEVAKASLKQKLNFINNFPSYAEANGIKTVRLNSGMMLATGVALAGGAAFTVYQYYQHKRRNA